MTVLRRRLRIRGRPRHGALKFTYSHLLRLKQQMTVAEVAAALNISYDTVYSWMTKPGGVFAGHLIEPRPGEVELRAEIDRAAQSTPLFLPNLPFVDDPLDGKTRLRVDRPSLVAWLAGADRLAGRAWEEYLGFAGPEERDTSATLRADYLSLRSQAGPGRLPGNGE